jgi:hypothetical protein
LGLLPRRCPVCRKDTIIGHGRRLRYSHDDQHECIWVRRGICEPCGKTFTILPDSLAPSGSYSLHCRQQACERIAAGDTAEQAAPHCKDSRRLPDSSTVRRWAQRRLVSLWCWVKAGVKDQHFLRAPTILIVDPRTKSWISREEILRPLARSVNIRAFHRSKHLVSTFV